MRFDPVDRLAGELTPPPDKSISHRAAIIGAMSDGRVQIKGYLRSADTAATLEAVTALGARLVDAQPRGAGLDVELAGAGLRGADPGVAALDVGNAGTLIRVLPGWLAGQPRGRWALQGDETIARRPVDRVVHPLRRMGATVDCREGGLPPLVVEGSDLHGIEYELPVASAQVKSAVLLAGLYANTPTTVIEPAITRDHTERMLLSFGCQVDAAHGEVSLTPPTELKACALEVPGDFSSAAFFMVAGSINPKKDAVLTITGVGINPTRTGLLDILALMGADLRVVNHRSAGAEPVADIEVRPAPLKGIHVPEHLVPLAIDEFPVLFVAASCAQGETIVTGAEELRVKESDRIAVMAEGLKAMGVSCEVLPDGIRIQGRPESKVFSGGTVDSHGDHRIAMSFSVASLRAAAPIKILDVANVATSFPDFPGTAGSAGLNVTVHD